MFSLRNMVECLQISTTVMSKSAEEASGNEDETGEFDPSCEEVDDDVDGDEEGDDDDPGVLAVLVLGLYGTGMYVIVSLRLKFAPPPPVASRW